MDQNWHRKVYELMPLPQRVEVARVAHEFRSQIPTLSRDGSIELVIKLWDLLEKEEDKHG